MTLSVIQFLPLLKTPEALTAFKEHNVTSFLKKYEAICNNFNIKEAVKVKKVLKYCENDIIYEVKSFKT